MTDDLIYWSHCSPVLVRHRQPEPKLRPIVRPAPKAEVMDRSSMQESLLRQMQNQRTGSQLYNNFLANKIGQPIYYPSGNLLGLRGLLGG